MRRRAFLGALGSAALAWSLSARAQQPTMPVIGYLAIRGPDDSPELLRGLRQGLKQEGFAEGENIAVVYRFAENQSNRLPELATDLAKRQVAVIVTSGGPQPAIAAKQVSSTIPILFSVAEDPVRNGLVASLARPGANLTGVNFLSAELAAKRLELLRELVPRVARVALLVNPNGATPDITTQDTLTAAQKIGIHLLIFHASTPREIDAAFEAIARERPDALLVGTDPLFSARRVQLANLTSRFMLPASHGFREMVLAGGLMSYGSDIPNAQIQLGIYAGRILKGEKPANLPVVQSNKLELVINLQTARTLGISVPQSLLVAADELID